MDKEVKSRLDDFIRKAEEKFELHLSEQERMDICISSYEDLKSFSRRDPSSHNDMLYILNTYLSYRAVLFYRIAHALHLKGESACARKCSEDAKLKTGIEIHPACVIGKRFVLDHGVGTVIGETTVIGDDCYILQSVIFGSKYIANNKSERRHPVIGNNVEIGGHVKIYGNVTIGNNVVISPGAVVKENVADNTRVIVSTDYQVQHGKTKILFTGYNENRNHIVAYFKNARLHEYSSIEVLNKGIALIKTIKENSIRFNRPEQTDNYYRFIFDGKDIIDVHIH